MTDPIGPIRAAVAGRYEIDREIGQGAFATVFLARDLRHDRLVAFKVLNADPTSENSELRFLREIRLLARLQHPNILPLIDSGHAEAMLYYVMPYVTGESLRQRMHREKQLAVESAVAIARESADALACAHEQGIIHRDIKPENILLSAGHPMIADFGVARAIDVAGVRQLTRTGTGSPGTPAYMSPEQMLSDRQVDQRTDTYSLGCVLYEMLTGKPPFPGKDGFVKRFTEPPPLPSILRKGLSPLLDTIVTKAMSREPKDRYPTAADFAESLYAASHTLSGAGEAAPPRAVERPAVALEAREASVTAFAPEVKPRRFNARILALAGILFLVVASGIYAYGARRRAATQNAGAPASRATGAFSTVAVIPFANTGGSPQDEYFSDGMSDELAHALSRLPQITVSGRSSSYAFKGKRVPAQEIGKALNVSAVVEGSIRRSGRRLRLIAQLTSAKTGQVLWSDTYESSENDLFKVQDDFTKAIVGALSPALGVSAAATAAGIGRGTEDQAAYELYLRGRFFFARRGAPGIKRAIRYFTQAAEKDPKFARAQAGISMAYGVMGAYALSDSAGPLALGHARMAIALDSSLGDAHLALANALSNASQYREAEVAFRRALEIQPEDATTHEWYGNNLSALGRIPEALAEQRHAATIDPLSAIIAHEVAYVYQEARRFKEAIDWSQRSLELDSTLTLAEGRLALGYVFSRQPEKAIEVMERSVARDPAQVWSRGILIFSYAAAGQWNDVRRLRDDLTRKSARVQRYELLLMHLAVGDREKALDIFEVTARRGFGFVHYGCAPEFDLLHTEPRFLAVLNRFGAVLCPATTPWPIKPPPADFARNE